MENTTQPSIKNRVKICADTTVFDSPQRVKIRRNDDTEFALILKNGGKYADISDIAVISLEIFDIGERNSPSPRKTTLLFKTTITRENITALENADGYNAVLKIPAEKSTFDAGEKWMRICAFSNNGERTTILQGWFDVEENFGDDTPSEIIEAKDIFLKSDDAKIYYLAKSANLSDLPDITLARQNLGVSSNAEISAQLTKYSLTSHSHSSYATKSQLQTLSDISATHSQLITDLAQNRNNKTNNSVLHCNGGYAVANNVDYPEVFSVAFRTDWNFADISKKFTPLKLGMSGTYGLNFYSISSDGRLRLYVNTAGVSNVAITSYRYADIATNLGTGLNSFVLVVAKDSDGNFLPKLYVNNNLIENPSTTKTQAFTLGSGEFKLNSYTSANTTAGDIAYQDVCVFNFDMSADDAPYTIADYQIGKSIPPSLKRGAGERFNIANATQGTDYQTEFVDCTGQYSFTNGVHRFEITEQTGNYPSGNFEVKFNKTIKAGSDVVINLKKASDKRAYQINFTPKYFTIQGNTAAQGTNSLTVSASNNWDGDTLINNRVKLTMDCNGCYIFISMSAGYFEFTDFSIEVNGATLALEDYTIGGKVLDYSGNKNHATITGSVAGDDDTRIEAFVETITTLTSQQN